MAEEVTHSRPKPICFYPPCGRHFILSILVTEVTMMKGLFDRCLFYFLLLGLTAPSVFGQDPNMTNVTLEEATAMPDANVTFDEADMDADDMDMDMDMNVTDDMMGNMTVPTQAPTVPTFPPSTADGCYTTLDAVYALISDDDKLFQQKRFVICPGSVMEVGFLVPGVGIDQGQAPLIPRSNTEFTCGEDGKSENNCIIKGGDFGLIAVPVFFRQDLSINNVQIKGFTFEGQVQYAAFVASAGDIAFIDCIIRVRQFRDYLFIFHCVLCLFHCYLFLPRTLPTSDHLYSILTRVLTFLGDVWRRRRKKILGWQLSTTSPSTGRGRSQLEGWPSATARMHISLETKQSFQSIGVVFKTQAMSSSAQSRTASSL